MADGGATFYIAMGLLAAGTVVTTMDVVEANRARQKILEQELRSAELQALDEENNRLQALRYADEEVLASAGGIGAFASPSLVAARAFNFRMGMQDLDNLRHNLYSARAATSAKIAILKQNSRAAIKAGIFEIAGTALSGFDKHMQLKKTPPGGVSSSKLSQPSKSILGGKS